jgi:uncharacterized membrane protein YkoI
MKKAVLVCGMLLAVMCCFAQKIRENEVPSLVMNTFKQRFPKATDIGWKQSGSLYEASFEVGSAEYEVWIDQSGKLIKLEQEIRESQLPAAVSAAISKEFSGYRTDDIERIEESGTITYKMELKKGAEEWKVRFDQSGKILDRVAD